MQDPHEFIDSVDSDLIYRWNDTGGYNDYGYTDWFIVATGDQVTLDAGVNRQPLRAVPGNTRAVRPPRPGRPDLILGP